MAARVTRLPDGSWVPGGPYIYASLSELGEQLAVFSEGPCRVVGEGAHVGRGRASSITQAVNVGRVVSSPERLLDPSGEALLVQPDSWKSKIFPPEWRRRIREQVGGQPSRSDLDKLASLAFVPSRVPGLASTIPILASQLKVAEEKLHHVTDSAGVAAYVHLGGA